MPKGTDNGSLKAAATLMANQINSDTFSTRNEVREYVQAKVSLCDTATAMLVTK